MLVPLFDPFYCQLDVFLFKINCLNLKKSNVMDQCNRSHSLKLLWLIFDRLLVFLFSFSYILCQSTDAISMPNVFHLGDRKVYLTHAHPDIVYRGSFCTATLPPTLILKTSSHSTASSNKETWTDVTPLHQDTNNPKSKESKMLLTRTSSIR